MLPALHELLCLVVAVGSCCSDRAWVKTVMPAPSSNKDRLSFGEEECELAACKSMIDALNRARVSAGQAGGKVKADVGNPQGASPSEGASEPRGDVLSGEALASWRRGHCPLSRESLGDVTWALLHSTAAYYPEKPTAEEQARAKGLVEGVAALYPCTHCREDFKEAIKEDPPKVESRESFSVWVCQQHNLVNDKLGKPTYKCDLASLDLRWRTGEKRCWGDPSTEGGAAASK